MVVVLFPIPYSYSYCSLPAAATKLGKPSWESQVGKAKLGKPSSPLPLLPPPYFLFPITPLFLFPISYSYFLLPPYFYFLFPISISYSYFPFLPSAAAAADLPPPFRHFACECKILQ